MSEPARPDVTTSELAQHLRVHRNTVINWVRAGKLVPDFWTSEDGFARWRRRSLPKLLRLMRERKRAA